MGVDEPDKALGFTPVSSTKTEHSFCFDMHAPIKEEPDDSPQRLGISAFPSDRRVYSVLKLIFVKEHSDAGSKMSPMILGRKSE